MNTTWKPTDKKKDLPDTAYAFPDKRKEPLTDASHVRNAIARFDQVKGVTDAERDQAFANIRKAAKHFDIEMSEDNWHQLGKKD
jgi:cell division protein FtsX